MTNVRSASGWNHWIWLSGTIMIGKADTIPKPRPAQSYPPSQSGFAFKFENGLVHAATPSPNVKFNWVPCRHWMGDGIGLCRLFGGEISACFLCPQEGKKGEPTIQPTNQPTNDQINKPTNQPTNQPTNKPTEPTNKSINQTVRPTDQQTNQRDRSIKQSGSPT